VAVAGHTALASGVEVSDDGHVAVTNGRRWRATDPAVPDDVAAELRRSLMSARQAVGAARAREHEAKTARGERGTPWWEQSADEREARWQTGR